MYRKLMDDYLYQNDWRVNENSNISHTYGGLVNYISSSVMAKYWLETYYNKEIDNAHTNCDLHIHDLGYFCGYCNGIDLKSILLKGISGVRGQTSSSPPSHFESALNMALTMLMLLQSEFAGAQAYSNFDTLLAPYIKKDSLTYEQVYQNLQNFVWSLNYPTRLGSQSPFTNLTFDVKVPKSFKKENPIIGNKVMEFTYEDCQEEMNLINKAFMSIMVKGDSNGKGFPYPIPTYSITKDFDWDNPILNQLFEMAAIYGIPYFQNLVNSNLDPDMIRSMCCRLQLDLRELQNMGGGLFGAESKTGSIGVVTINLARIGYTCKTKNEFFNRLDYLLNIAKDSLEIKRTVITEWMDKGLYPYTKEYVGSFNTFFSTIGLNGANEMCLNFLGNDITTVEGKEFTLLVLEFIREKIREFQVSTGHLYNLEQTPAESTAGRFARKDRKLFPDMIIPGEDRPYYTNSVHIPVNKTTDVFEVFNHQNELVEKFTGGSVVHIFLGESIEDFKIVKNLVKKLCKNYKIPYFTISPTYCYDDKTEVLTESGWKLFKELLDSDKVCTLNHETQQIEYHKPDKYYEYDYSGKMIHFNGRSIDCCVTPNHRMYIKPESVKMKSLETGKFINATSEIHFKAAEKLSSNNRIPNIGFKWEGIDNKYFTLEEYKTENITERKQLYNEKNINMYDWISFMGIWIAEGSVQGSKGGITHKYRINVSQCEKVNKENYNKIDELLQRLPFKFTKYKTGFEIYDAQLWNYLKQFGNSGEKFIPHYIKELSKKYLNAFLKWYLMGDGHIRHIHGNEIWTSFSKSKRLNDDLQEIYLKLGYSSSLLNNTVTRLTSETIDPSKGKKIIDYTGKVYCVEVINNIIYVRRNGRPLFSGNSVCDYHGFLKGECHTCPKCEEELNSYKHQLEELNVRTTT